MLDCQLIFYPMVIILFLKQFKRIFAMNDDNFYNKVTNSRFYSFGDKLGDIMILSLLWLVFCIPVVTAVPSTAALYYAVRRRRVKHSGSPKSDFFKSFKENIKQGTIINIIYVLYSAVAVLNILIGYYGIGNIKMPDFYFPTSFILLIPIVFTYPFVIALLARYDNTTVAIFKNGFTLSTMYLGTTIKIWLIMILSLALMIVFFPAALVLPYFSCRLVESMVDKIFKYASRQEAARNVRSAESEDVIEEDVENEEI